MAKVKATVEVTVGGLVDEMKGHWAEFEKNHAVYTEKKNRSAAGRARKSIGALRKLVTPYRKALIAECKAAKK